MSKNQYQEYQHTIIRSESQRQNGEEVVVEVGLERAYRNNPMGSNYCAVKIGEWEVVVAERSVCSTIRLDADSARRLSAAILIHAAEADRRNNPPPVPSESDDAKDILDPRD